MTQPVFDDVLPAVKALFEQIEREPNKNELEIELRFGKLGEDGKFVPGVKREFMDTAICRLNTNSSFKSTEWIEHEDYFYSVDTPIGKKQVRTRVSFDPYEFTILKEHVEKRRLATVTIQSGEVAFRVSLSRESLIDESLIPSYVNTDLVRIQQRKRIFCSRTEHKARPWCYECSLIWSGKTKSKVESSRWMPSSCNHEFEIELDMNSSYFRGHCPDYLARSLLLKATDFLESHANLSLHKVTLASERKDSTETTTRL
jgi:hypothetical protein